MTKNDYIKISLIAIVLSVAVNVVFGRYLAVMVSTWPLLNRLRIVSPQAPIVMTNREVVRVSETGDIVQVANNVKPKVSSVYVKEDGRLRLVGNALNFTSEGLFITTQSVVVDSLPEQLVVRLNDGTIAQVMDVARDPATSLALLRAEVRNASVVAFGSSEQLQAGDKVVFLRNGITDFAAQFTPASVYAPQSEPRANLYQADMPVRTFQTEVPAGLIPGQSVVNFESEVVGIWNGSSIVSSDVIREMTGAYFNNGQQITRPHFGFWYEVVLPVEAKVYGTREGARVARGPEGELAMAASSPVAKAGLREGDVITAVGDMRLSRENTLEKILHRYKPGDAVTFTVFRGNQSMDFSVTVQQLK